MIPLGLWPRYAAFWVPGCPPQGNPWEADHLFGLAFGRNGVTDEALWMAGAEWGVHGFNDQATRLALFKQCFNPGQANKELAAEAIANWNTFGIPLVLQWEIYVALPSAWLREHRDQAFAIWPPASGARYWNSRQVAMEGLKIMHRRGLRFRRPALLAHKWHALRGYLLTRPILGKDLIVLPQRTECFDPDSVQKHTTSREEWLKREWKGRAHHVLHGLV